MNEQTRAETFSHTWASGLGADLGKLCSSHRIMDLGTHLYRLGQQLFPRHTYREMEIWTDRTAYGSDFLTGASRMLGPGWEHHTCHFWRL